MNLYSGISISGGIGIGNAFVVMGQTNKVVSKKQIIEAEIAAGWKKFEDSVQAVSHEVNLQLEKLPPASAGSDAPDKAILEAYLMMLGDTVFFDDVKKYYEKNLCDISYAVYFKTEEVAEQMRALGDTYLAARAQDITDIFGRVLNVMSGLQTADFGNMPENCIIVAEEFAPLDMITVAQKKIKGVVLADSNTTGHTAILAKHYKIPMVCGIEKIDVQIASGETVIVDGEEAKVFVSPNDNFLNSYKDKIK